jgi:hydrogenase maturation factor
MGIKMYIGKVPENILKLSILNQLHSKNEAVIKGAGGDCALFASGEGYESKALAACVQEAAVAAKADIGKCAAHKRTMAQLITRCVNNLAVGGAVPVAAMITLLLPEDTDNTYIRTLMSEADEACGKFLMQIAGGQTKILSEIKEPLAVINAYGIQTTDRPHVIQKAKHGQDIVLSKWAGLEGTASIAALKAEEINKHYPAYLVKEAETFDKYLSVSPEAEIAIKNGVTIMHDASEGGILAALWELAEGAGCGLDIDIRKIPLRQETVEICECTGVNPYGLLSGGCLIMTADEGESLVSALEAENIHASVIGKTTSEKARIIRNEDEVRYMDRPGQDEIYKFI